MDYKKFTKIVDSLKAHEKRNAAAVDLKIDLIDYCDDLHTVIDILLEEAYGKDGADWFNWFRFESDYGRKEWKDVPVYEKNKEGKLVQVKDTNKKNKKTGAWDENGEPICYSVKSTWEFLEKNYSKNNKNAKKEKRNSVGK